jgi:heterodisulfide reductase subunit A
MAKIGVVLCTCGDTLSEKINFEELKEFIKSFPEVEEVLITKDFCKSPEEKVSHLKGKVDALIFGGCSERSSLQFNEDRAKKLVEYLGIDPSMYETMNLREQCCFIHEDKEGINQKAKDMFLIAFSKLKTASKSFRFSPKKRVLVVGGGVAGQRCAQTLSDLGIETVLLEEKPYLGGLSAQLSFVWQSEGYPSVCTTECVMPVVGRDTVFRNIKLMLNSQVVDVVKENGNFKVKIKKKAQKVDPEKCIGCGKCAQVCPVEVPNEFELGKKTRKAIDKPFALALPDTYHILESACTLCGECEKVCPTGAINLNAKDEYVEEEFGAIVLATGLKGKDLSVYEELGYKYPEVITLIELERYLANQFYQKKPKEIAFVLCKKDSVGYCSKLCCLATVKSAEFISKMFPDIKIRVFYLSLRTTGRAFEELRRRAEKNRVEFIEEPVLKVVKNNGKLTVETEKGKYSADLVVLAEPLVPSQTKLTKILEVETDRFGFPVEFQPKVVNPLETYVERVFVAGGAKGFKDIQESIESGHAVAVKVFNALNEQTKKFYSKVDPEKCSKCGTCAMSCPHGAVIIKKGEKPEENIVEIDPGFCRGCGLCYSACPSNAIRFFNFEDMQIIKMAENAFKNLPPGKPRILAFLCYWCSYGAGDLMGIKGEKLPENLRVIKTRCSASLSLDAIVEIIERDLADAIIVAGCSKGNCHHLWGNYMQESRISALNENLRLLGVSDKIVRWEYIGVAAWKKLAKVIREVNKKLLEVKGGK